MKLRHLPVTVIVVAEEWQLVDGALEDEPRPAGGAEGRRAEGADGSEGMRPVWKRGLSPVPGCPLRADVAARHKSVSGGSSVHVHSRLAAQPQGHVGTHAPAQGTFSAGRGTLALSWHLHSLRSLAPVVASVDVAASEVDPGLTLFKAVAAWQAGEGQCAEADRTLGPGRIELLAKCFQVTQSGSTHEPLACTPQQGGTTQVNQGTVT